ncbi:GrpB family protein [Hymenobacter cavernae]|uniref:GrpB family protein n=1 Tax=Hymenobacter cavernae TaxID=2044852 RepID=A0ABQ1UNI4_9BACT|nr:GrpB family protein [Hymenobacter cavernae]GGF23297.1 hypothetical protein GCM10011383_38680 [Hymenobacter cavernae]
MRKIEIVEYNPSWPTAFQELAQVYAAALGEWLIGIEHVGSTAVPGLAAKPVIDIDLVIQDQAVLPVLVAPLAALGYQHLGNRGVKEREAFKQLDENAPYTTPKRTWPAHHLYVCLAAGAGLTNHLSLRNYLRTHPEQAQAYAALKRDLARRFPYASEQYVEGKTTFIGNIIGNG